MFFKYENVLFPCQHKIREYYPIRDKHNKFAILVMKLATTITVILAFRHYRIDGWFSSWLMLTCTCYFFVLQNATIAMVGDDATYLFFFFVFLRV